MIAGDAGAAAGGGGGSINDSLTRTTRRGQRPLPWGLSRGRSAYAIRRFDRTARWDQFSEDELSYLAAKAGLPERLVIATARATVEAFRETWANTRAHLPLSRTIADVIDRQLEIIPLAGTQDVRRGD